MIIDAYKRWRHSHGFGVHSPFAYNLVTSAIHPGRGYGFYGYEAIERALEEEENLRNENFRRHNARLLLRLAIAMNLKRIFLPPDADRALRAAVIAAGADSFSITGGDALNQTPDCGADPATALAILSPGQDPATLTAAGIAVLIISEEKIGNPDSLLPPEPFRGLIFTGTRRILIVPREKMVRTVYSMAF